MWSTSFVLFEAAATLTDAVVVNVKEKNVLKTGDSPEKRGAHETAALAKPLHDIAHMWFGFQTQDPLLLAQQLAALTSFAFAGYYRSDLQLLGSVLEKLFALLTFVPPAEAFSPAFFSPRTLVNRSVARRPSSGTNIWSG